MQVRQREAEQMRRHLVRSSETQQKLDMLSRLGSLCRILNRYGFCGSLCVAASVSLPSSAAAVAIL